MRWSQVSHHLLTFLHCLKLYSSLFEAELPFLTLYPIRHYIFNFHVPN